MKNIHVLSKVNSIHITSDEEIKEGDWCLDIKRNIIFQSKRNDIGTSKKIPIIICTYEGCYIQKDCKKIILTTDKNLDGVQEIPDEFLEWFVNNPNCEEVEVEKMFNVVQFTSREFIYKIIIPKEEPKQLAVEWLYNHLFPKQLDGFSDEEWNKIDLAFNQAKEMENQQKGYSEEYLEVAFFEGRENNFNSFNEWFEQFKNK